MRLNFSIDPVERLESFIGGALLGIDYYGYIARGQPVYHLTDVIMMSNLHKSSKLW